MGEFGRFLIAVGKRWWALMSCAIFTGLGVFSAYANKNNSWIVEASFAAAVVCLFIACFLAWRDEHRKLAEEQAKNEGSRIEADMIVALVDSKKETPDGRFSLLPSGCHIYLCITATNMNPTPAYLNAGRTSLNIDLDGRSYVGQYGMLPYGRMEYFTEAAEIHSSSGHRNISDFFQTEIPRFPMERGIPRSGWLRFYFPELDESALRIMGSLCAHFELTFTDTLRKRHPITGNLNLQLDKVHHLSEPIKM
jgi:hypothetical protein